MFKIEITETAENKLDFADMLRRIADQIDRGDTISSLPGWCFRFATDEMPNYHLFTVKRLFQTNTKPHRTAITSERYGVTVEITEQNAIDYLIEKGYNIVAEAEGHTHKNGVKPMYLLSDTFKPFTK